MFGTNPIVGKSYFKNAPSQTLMVTSIFYTLQGEGPHSGKPCVFVRLSKCNLACSFCDTLFERGEVMTFQQIWTKIYHTVCDYWNTQGKPVPFWAMPHVPSKDKLRDYRGPYGFGLVVTGGEPTLQANLVDFLEAANQMFAWTQIESNGIITLPLPQQTTVVVSPKCAEKDGVPTKYLKPTDEMLKRADALKFVMCAPIEHDIHTFIDSIPDPYEEVPEWAHNWAGMNRVMNPEKQVFVSPRNVYNSVPKKMKLEMNHASEHADRTLEERSTEDEVVSFWEPGVLNMQVNQRNHEHAAKYAIANGFRFQVQTHLLASLA